MDRLVTLGRTIGIMLLIFSGSFVFSQQEVNLKSIPDGYMAGRADAPYGTYKTVVGASARPLQDRLVLLENKVHGLAKLTTGNPVELSKNLYILENEVIRLHQDISNADGSNIGAFERESLLVESVRLYKTLRTHAERVFEDMVRYIDVKMPGPNGMQFRKDLQNSVKDSIYLPNYRSDNPLTAQEREKLYAVKVSEFTSKGGSLNEIVLLNQQVLHEMKSYTRVEYVVRENNDIFITKGSAGHLLLAEGKSVKAAGQMIFIKNSNGQFTMLIVSNSSGNFKPDILSAEFLAQRLAKDMMIGMEKVIVTKGEPINSQPVKIYLKADGVDKAKIEKTLADLETAVKDRIIKNVYILPCKETFALSNASGL